ncbi:MAG: hypothetical protein WAM11_09345 [Cyanobium sp.]
MTVVDSSQTVVNRCAVTVTPNQSMIDWTRPFWTPQEQHHPVVESSLYLIPTYDNESQALACLQGCYEAIFASELNLWCRDQQLWPRSRNFELFLAWFSLQFHHLVEDLGGEPLGCLAVDPSFEERLREGLN